MCAQYGVTPLGFVALNSQWGSANAYMPTAFSQWVYVNGLCLVLHVGVQWIFVHGGELKRICFNKCRLHGDLRIFICIGSLQTHWSQGAVCDASILINVFP